MPPTLTIDLSGPPSSIGFMMYFDKPAGCWPSLVRITVSRDGTQLARKEFSNDGPVLAAELKVQEYNKVVIRTALDFL